MTFDEFRIKAPETAAALGIGEYEMYYMEDDSQSVSAMEGEIQEFSSDVTGGVTFRCKVNGKMGYCSTEQLSAEEAERIVKAAAENAAGRASRSTAEQKRGGWKSGRTGWTEELKARPPQRGRVGEERQTDRGRPGDHGQGALGGVRITVQDPSIREPETDRLQGVFAALLYFARGGGRGSGLL
jgi:hypothetical protein